jgi:hypothetical protein
LATLLRADPAEPGGGLPAELLDEFVAAGGTHTCKTMVERLLAAGADRVVLVPNPAGRLSTESMITQTRAAARLAR